MKLVGQLSQGVVGFCEEQKTKLLRTSVKASDAAGAKVKGLKRSLGDAADPSDPLPKISKCTDGIQLPQNNVSRTSDFSKCPGNIQLPETTVSSTRDIFKGVENVQLLHKAYSSTTEAKKLPQKTRKNKKNKIKSRIWSRRDKGSSIKSTSSGSQFLKKCPFVRAAESPLKEGTDGQENKVTEKSGGKETSSKDNWMLIKEGESLMKEGTDQQENNETEKSFCEEISSKDHCILIEKAQSNRHKLMIDISKINKAVQRCCKDVNRRVVQMQAGPYGDLFLFEDINCPHPYQVLAFSTLQCRIPFRMEYSAELTSTCCKILVNGLVVVSVAGPSKKIAREVAVRCAVEKLKDVCYTLKVKKERVPDDLVIEKATFTSVDVSAPKESCIKPLPTAKALATPLPEDHIGSRLMKSMGWKGGGLGKAEQGIQEPISVSLKVNRTGLGTQEQVKEVESNFIANVQHYLAQYLELHFPPNLIFKSNEFSMAERTLIQLVAKVLGLESTIIGKGDETHLKISRKDKIVELMLHHGECSDEYYELLPPRNPSTGHHEAECLQASDFPHLYCQESSDTIYEKYIDGYNVLESDVLFGDYGHFLVNNITKNVNRIGQRHKVKKYLDRRAAMKSKGMVDTKFVRKKFSQKSYALDAIAAGPYGPFFLLEHKGENLDKVAVIIRSAKSNHVPITHQYGWLSSGTVCRVIVNNHLLTSAFDFNRKEAYKLAYEDAYDKLKQMCYVLEVDDCMIDRNELKKFEYKPTEAHSLEKPLQENISSKLIQAEGWTGEDLEMEQKEIHESMRSSVLEERAGLGLEDEKLPVEVDVDKFQKQMFNLLSEYKAKKKPYGLTFSSEFTREERKVTHQLCLKLKLYSKSYGKGKDRRLTVSHKDYNEVVEQILLSGEYSNSKYQLIKPSIALQPENKNYSQTNCENDVKCEDAIVSPIVPSGQVPEDLPSQNVAGTPCENISTVIVKPVDVAVQNIVDEDLQRRNGIGGPFGSLVLIEDETIVTPIELIRRSANICCIPFKLKLRKVRGGMECRVLVNCVLVASSVQITQNRAKEVAIRRSLVKLKDECCTLKTEIEVVDGSIRIIKSLKKPNKRSVGFGKDSETVIVCVSKEVNRLSLGMNEKQTFEWNKKKLINFLERYLTDSCPYDLIFSPEFSETEKSWIQNMASSFSLKVTMYNVFVKKYMVMSKELSSIELANAILMSGGNVEENENVRLKKIPS